MYRRSISIITAASIAALAGQAVAQQQMSQSEARQLSQKLEQSDKSLVDAIQLAERETGGKALAASLMTDRAVEEAYRRQGGGQTERQTDRDTDRDMPRRPGQDQDERQREMEQRERELEERQREREREGERNRQQENRDRLTGGQQRGLHAEVTCLVDGQQLRKVVVNLEESRVVDSRSVGAGDDQQRTTRDSSAGSATQMRLASTIINADAVNAQGDGIGDIDDLALDVSSGKVRYAVLRAGGFLGMGGDRHAVPLSALTFAGEDEVRINVTEEQIEQREGFDTDRWPQHPSPAWGGQPGQQDRQQEPGQDRQPEAQRPGQPGQQQMSSTVEKASDVIGATLHGAGDASVGDVDDIVIKTADSSIAHYIIATDDGKLAVPADKIRMVNRRLTLDMQPNEFERLPRFRDNENPDWTNPQWLRDSDERRELDPQRPARQPGNRGG